MNKYRHTSKNEWFIHILLVDVTTCCGVLGLTIDNDCCVCLFGVLATGDAALVLASVCSLEPRDGQDTVEQHVCFVLQEPLGNGAAVAVLKVEKEEE